MEKYEFLEPTDVKNFWKKYGLTGNAFLLPCGKTCFFFFFPFATTPTAFLVVVKPSSPFSRGFNPSASA